MSPHPVSPGKKDPRQAADITPGGLRARKEGIKPHQDQPQQAAAFLMHQDTSLTTTIGTPRARDRASRSKLLPS
ncbi:hypothetical protein Q5P01_006009 [Channa striata]|uniref:Uncharacterized protein n=1 Tax=Channa striata TaxID=64152 RepID=A0AA88T012_CHASR|nr:hypothetical protein Q5P01_006009 [Channa striata]